MDLMFHLAWMINNVELTIDRKQCKGTAEFQWPSARKKESRTEIYHRPIHKTQKVTNRIYHTSKQTREPIGRGTQWKTNHYSEQCHADSNEFHNLAKLIVKKQLFLHRSCLQ